MGRGPLGPSECVNDSVYNRIAGYYIPVCAEVVIMTGRSKSFPRAACASMLSRNKVASISRATPYKPTCRSTTSKSYIELAKEEVRREAGALTVSFLLSLSNGTAKQFLLAFFLLLTEPSHISRERLTSVGTDRGDNTAYSSKGRNELHFEIDSEYPHRLK